MNEIFFLEAELEKLYTHHIGNKYREEDCTFSEGETYLNAGTKEYLLKYFFDKIKTEEVYGFDHPVEMEMNEVYTIVGKIFSGESDFKEQTQALATMLYEKSIHPKIKAGNLNIAYFKSVHFNEELVDAIGIFKSETDTAFLKMKPDEDSYHIEHDYGYDIKGIDKACVILNKFPENGYRIYIVDRINKGEEAKYWKDEFLEVKPLRDEYNQTNEFLGITKEYITKELPKEFEMEKTDQIDLLNRSVEFFKENETFNQKTFNEDVFGNAELIASFNNYNEDVQEANNIQVNEEFDISKAAVKKQARIFKSVLKLDKNFSIYIHGNKDLVEKGEDDYGRKFYKFYYENES